jgi:hypothetical protein
MYHPYSYSSFSPNMWHSSGFGLGFGSLGLAFTAVAGLWILFTIVLKGYALWRAARRGDKWWFIFLLILNTLGILELIYIVFIVKDWPGKAQQTGHVAHDGHSHDHDPDHHNHHHGDHDHDHTHTHA